jgi:hypothetical protein
VLGAGAASQQVVQIALVAGASTPYSFTAATFSYNTWNHAAGVLSSNTQRAAYLNGVTGGPVDPSVCNFSSLPNVSIGSRYGTSYGLFANSRIAEVGVWSAALTAAELGALAKGVACKNIHPQSLVFYAPLIRELADERGGRSITNVNGATVFVHPRVYA